MARGAYTANVRRRGDRRGTGSALRILRISGARTSCPYTQPRPSSPAAAAFSNVAVREAEGPHRAIKRPSE